MSANFYTTGGWMLGFDLHNYWTVGPLGAPVPTKAVHFVVAHYEYVRAKDPTTKVACVTADTHKMVQGECELTLIPHIPIPPGAPHLAAEVLELGLIVGFSGSAPLVRRQSVTAKGKPLAVCTERWFGTNINCSDPVNLPSGDCLHFGTVMTQPSAADAVAAITDWIIDSIFGTIVGKAGDKVFGRLVEGLLKQAVKKCVEEIVKKLITDKAKESLNKIEVRPLLSDLEIPFL